MKKCENCGIPESKSSDWLIEIDGGDGLICCDCLDNGALGRKSDQHVFKKTGYVVERS